MGLFGRRTGSAGDDRPEDDKDDKDDAAGDDERGHGDADDVHSDAEAAHRDARAAHTDALAAHRDAAVAATAADAVTAASTVAETPYGVPGRPLSSQQPFVFGFFAAIGALLAFFTARLVYGLSSVLVLIAVSFFIAVGLDPAVRWFMRRGLKRPWAVLVVVVVALVAVALFLFALVPVITDQVQAISSNVPGWLDQLQTNKQIQKLDDKYDIISKLQHYITGGDLAQRVFGGVLGVGLAVLGFLANTFLVIVMTLYFLASLPKVKSVMWSFAPASRRERATKLGEQILNGIGAYVSGAFVVASCAGVSSLIMLLIVGLGEYAVALAVVVALLDAIPMIGATIGAVVVCAIGFATDVQTGIILAIFYVLYQQLENYVIYPRVMARAIDLPGLLTVIAVLIGSSLLGVVGALMAIPTAAAAVLLVREILFRRQDAR